MQEIVDFVLELDRLKAVERKVRPTGLARQENSAEHSWHIAMMGLALARFAERPVDVARVTAMLLVHDVGEIDAGDRMVFARDGWTEQKAAELASVRRIFGLLPEAAAAEMLELWEEFEAAETPEARYAHAVDRAMPVLLNLANDGGSWREHGIGYERVVERIRPEVQAGCPALWEYLDERLETARKAGWFGIGAVGLTDPR